MFIIKTIDLEKKLRSDDAFDESAVMENKAPDIHILINKHMIEKNVRHADLIRAMNVDRSYGYQLLNGKRVPTRDQLIKIGLFMGLDLDEIQRLLKIARKDILYARNMTDAKVIYAVEHALDYGQACEFIWRE